MKIKLIDFRKLAVTDICDHYYNDGHAWSRIYEYPVVLNAIKKLVPTYSECKIHNSSWGFEGIHVKFKEKLDLLTSNCTHSDVRYSKLEKTFIYDITSYPTIDMINAYDVVINISTMEEVNHDHVKVFYNLISQVKPGGYFIATFDLPGLQLDKFETLFSKQISIEGTPVNGGNSECLNKKHENLNVGLMIIHVL